MVDASAFVVFLLVWILRCTSPVMSAAHQNFGRNEILDGYKCPNEDLIFTLELVKSSRACAAQCSSFPACHGIFYQPETFTCFGCAPLYDVTAETLNGSMFYRRQACSSYGTTYTIHPNLVVNSDYSAAYSGVTQTECLGYCSNSSTCLGVTFCELCGGICRLRSETPYTSPESVESYPNIDYYLRNCA